MEDVEGEMTIHGPLGGLLGYISRDTYSRLWGQESEGPRFSQSDTYILGGLLWNASQQFGSDGRVSNSSHGPLWGMFGWGREDGRFALRLFWMSVAF